MNEAREQEHGEEGVTEIDLEQYLGEQHDN